MERRGRKRTPVSVLKYGGSWRHKEKTDANALAREMKEENLPSPSQDSSAPSPSSQPMVLTNPGYAAPEWLSSEGRKEWEYLMQRLEPIGLFLSIDRNALGRYCETMVLWNKAKDQAMNLCGLTEEVGSERYTKIQIAGSIMVMEQLGKTLSSMERELGLTANARSTIPIEKPKKKRGAGPAGTGLSIASFQRAQNG